MDVEVQPDDVPPFQPTPAGEMRRGSAIMLLVCVVIFGIGRLFFWHGKATSSLPAIVLFFLLMYTIFGFVQLLFGASFNEYSQNFMRATGRQRLLCIAMLVLTLALLVPLCGFLMPGIWDKI